MIKEKVFPGEKFVECFGKNILRFPCIMSIVEQYYTGPLMSIVEALMSRLENKLNNIILQTVEPLMSIVPVGHQFIGVYI